MATRRRSEIRIPTPDYSFKITSAPNLPLEIIETILSGLSIKSLLRFKSVSKSWNKIISDPVFIRPHHHKSKSGQDLFLCSLAPHKLLCSVNLEDKKLERVETQQAPRDCYDAICFCDGALLYKDCRGRCVLWNWNLSARTVIQLDNIPLSGHLDTIGVCQNPTDNDFKVVAVDNLHYSVYSCKKRSWSNVQQLYNIVNRLPSMGPAGISVDGAIYWVFWPRYRISCREIRYYNPRDGKFKILQKPKDVDDDKIFDLAVLGGSLCLYCHGTNWHTLQIWTKEKGIDKNCWDVLIAIHNVDMPNILFDLQPQCLFGNKIVFRTKYHRSLMVYSPLENKFEQFEEGTSVYVPGLIPYITQAIKSTRPKTKPRGLPKAFPIW